MKKSVLISIIAAVALVVFLACNCKVIDKGTEGQYTGVVAFDAGNDSSGDWAQIVAEITENAVDAVTMDLSALGAAKAVTLSGTVSEYVSKANGKKNSLIIQPDGYSGSALFSVQIGTIYSGTAVRDAQTLKAFGDFTNQTEWSKYAMALNQEVDTQIVAPLGLGEDSVGKKISLIGAATATGNEVVITPIAISIE